MGLEMTWKFRGGHKESLRHRYGKMTVKIAFHNSAS